MIWYDLLEESQCQEQQFDSSPPPPPPPTHRIHRLSVREKSSWQVSALLRTLIQS